MSHRNVDAAVKARTALQMRQLGHTYERIAEQCGYSDRGRAFHAVQRELQRTIAPVAEDVRELELTRLDQLLTVYYAKAMKGDGWSLDRVLRIMERRTAYLGLDAPPAVSTAAIPVIVEVPQTYAAMIRGQLPAITEIATSGSSDSTSTAN